VTFSYNLLLALFLLAPGFGAYFGLFSATRQGRYQPSPPAPNSVLTLGVVVLGAMLAHAVLAVIYSALDYGVARDWWRQSPLPYMRGPYEILFSAAVAHSRVRNADVAVFLCCGIGLTGLSGAAALWVRSGPLREAVGPLLYGWLGELVAAGIGPDTYVNAFVLTDIQVDGRYLGYEGVLENLTVSADKEITAVLLKQVETFYVRLDAEAVTRVPIPRERTIPQLYLERSQIKNIAFVPYAVVEEFSVDAAPDAEA
jgi:hypothetical protein